jgi:hypothetical protein
MVSSKRASLLFEFKTTMKIPYFTLAKHAPAGPVCPVLMPSHPSESSLLVVYHLLKQLILFISSS